MPRYVMNTELKSVFPGKYQSKLRSMKNVSKFIIQFMLVMGMGACFEDKGNYDYKELPVVGITNIEEKYGISQFDTLRITPHLILEQGSEGDYDYLWRIWSSSGLSPFTTMSEKLELEYWVSELPGSYNINLTVTERSTGLQESYDMSLTVSGIITEGWMVLHEKDGKTDFDLITDRFFVNRILDKDVRHRNVYEMTHGEPFPGKIVKLGSFWFPLKHWVYLFTENGGIRLSGGTMQTAADLSSLFLEGGDNLQPAGYGFIYYWNSQGRGAEVLISNGHFYINPWWGSTFVEPVCQNGLTYHAAPFVARKMRWSFVSVIYDELQARFLQVNSQVMQVNTFPSNSTGVFDVNNMNADMCFLETGFNGYEYAVMKNRTTGEYSLCLLDFTSEENNFAKQQYSMADWPGVDRAINYAVGARGNVFYYCTSEAVYMSNMDNKPAKECLTVPADEKITSMRLLKPNEHGYLTNHPYDSKVLIVGTWNETTQEGKVYMYYVNETDGVIDMDSMKVFDGFGKILDMDYNWAPYGS